MERHHHFSAAYRAELAISGAVARHTFAGAGELGYADDEHVGFAEAGLAADPRQDPPEGHFLEETARRLTAELARIADEEGEGPGRCPPRPLRRPGGVDRAVALLLGRDPALGGGRAARPGAAGTGRPPAGLLVEDPACQLASPRLWRAPGGSMVRARQATLMIGNAP